MIRRLALWACCLAGYLAFGVSTARAERLVVRDVHGEADVADEAAAVSYLLRSAFKTKDDRTLIEAPADLTLGIAVPTLSTLHADHVVLLELTRDGTGLRVVIVVGDSEGKHVVSHVHAGDGDLTHLAQRVVDQIVAQTHALANPVATTSLGRLRPYVIAARTGNPDALVDATPTTANAVPAVVQAIAKLPQSLVVARANGSRALLDAIPTTTPDGVAAHALAALDSADLSAADAILGRPVRGETGFMLLARALLAEDHNDRPRLQQLIRDGLASNQPRAMLAFASTLAGSRFTPALLRSLLGAIDPAGASSGVVSRLALLAAEAKVDAPRALALISVRELDDAEVARLVLVIGGAQDAAILRLRAEVAMRHDDGTQDSAIDAFLAAAPNDPRAHLYQGYVLLGAGKLAEAAAAFAAAGNKQLLAHALLADGKVAAAATSFDQPTSAEELAIAALAALAANKTADAELLIARAEKLAPANPLVQRANLVIATRANDAPRAQVARLVADDADPPTTPATPTTTLVPLEPTAAGSAHDAAPLRPAMAVDIEPAEIDLAPLLEALHLERLPIHTVAIAKARWSAPIYSLHATHADRLEPPLVDALTGKPHQLAVVRAHPVDDAPLRLAEVTELLGSADALLVYRVRSSGSDATVTLTLYPRGAAEGISIERTVVSSGLVTWDLTKLAPLAVLALALILVAMYFAIRGTGYIKLAIDRASDATDELFCVEISKSPTRPQIGDPLKFQKTTRAAGTITKRRSGTLIASGMQFKVAPGRWYVHLYGTQLRGSVLIEIPSSCTAEVVVQRGKTVRAELSLVPVSAELHVRIDARDRARVAMWVDAGEKVFSNSAGLGILPLPLGEHTVHFEQGDIKVTRTVSAATQKIYRLAINLDRERKLIDAGLSLDISPTAKTELGVSSGAVFENEGVAVLPDLNTSGVSFRKTSVTAPPFELLDKPAPLVPGLERYGRIAELGRGAMGVVYRAWDSKLERDVAMKVMSEDLRTNPAAMQLFTQEAKSLAQLSHGNIVAVYDQVTVGDDVYMIMEYVDGTTLEDTLAKRHTFPWRDAIGVADQLCAALAYAHARNVIHRDIKPANIFMAKDGSIKLGDFGLARVLRELTIRRTEIRGTPLYMAPEQIAGIDIDHRADLYAVGCTLFELVTGRPPFVDGDIMYQQVHGTPVAPSTLVAVPAALDRLILDLLAKSADDRPGSAGEVRTILKSVS